MNNMIFFKLVQYYLEERQSNNIHAQECAFTAIAFRMAIQYGFSVLLKLVDLK